MSAAKSLTKEQVEEIQSWANQGARLSEIQRRLAGEMGIKVTYMELRFLLDDIGVELLPEEKPAKAKEEPSFAETDLIADSSEPGGGVAVTINEVQRPGAMVSGRVTFANGQKAEWYLDRYGRIGMEPDSPEYRPTAEDLREFQVELQKVARKRGF